jgi:hypothetical protein
MRVKGFDVVELLGAGIVVAVGVTVTVSATGYTVGELRRMGPGYLPLATGALLAVLGLALALASRATATTVPRLRFKPPLMLFAGLTWWAATIEGLGLVPSTIGMIVLVSLAQERPRLRTVALTTLLLVVFALVVFIWALGIPIDVLG